MNRYLLYARKSSDAEDRQVLSIHSQLRELRELAKKENLTIIREYTEARTSKKPGRKIFNEMLTSIEAGEADSIIAWHPDRLARNSIDGGKILFLLDTGMIKDLKFPTFRFDNSAYGKFMLNIAFGQSKYYIDNLSENVKRGIREKLKRGEFPGWAPIGYNNDLRNHTIVLDPEKAPLVRKIFEVYSDGEHSIREICRISEQIGLKSRYNKPISKCIMVRTLQNPFYYGVFSLKGELFEGSHPPLITKSLFDRVQEVFQERSKPTRKAQYHFAFRGYMSCGECGAMITAEKKKGKYIYYHCTKRKGKCSQGYIEEKELAAQITEALESIYINDEDSALILNQLEEHKTVDESEIERKILKARDELAAVSGQMEKLIDTFLAEYLSEEEFQSRKKKMIERKAELNGLISDLDEGHLEWFELAKEAVNTCNSVEKIISGKNYDEISKIIQKTGSNFFLKEKKLRFSFREPYRFISSGDFSDDLFSEKDLPPSLGAKGTPKKKLKKRVKIRQKKNWLPGLDGSDNINFYRRFNSILKQ